MKEIEHLSSNELEIQKKDNFLESLRESFADDYLPKNWDEKRKASVVEATNKKNSKKAMLTAIPMTCRGDSCSFRNTCPLYQVGDHPLGHACPIEMGMILDLFEDYVEALDVDTNNGIEMEQVRSLVNQDVQIMRATKLLAQESFIQENVVGMDSEGDPIMQKQLHLGIDYEDKKQKWRQAFLKNMLATREARSKSGLESIQRAEQISNIMYNLDNLRHEEDAKLKRALGIVETDSYIEAKEAEKRALEKGD